MAKVFSSSVFTVEQQLKLNESNGKRYHQRKRKQQKNEQIKT